MSPEQDKTVSAGDKFLTNSCGVASVIEYVNNVRVLVRFDETGYETWCQLAHLRRGGVKDPLFPSVCGVGVFGVGPYSRKNDEMAYRTWKSMMDRCYSERLLKLKPSYFDCEVCEEWQDFQVFAEWFYGNYVDGGHLDKDIMSGYKVGKLYSPDNCMFVTNKENTRHSQGVSGQLLSPSGDLVKFDCISEFCEFFGLEVSNVSAVLSGRRNSCGGWTRPSIDPFLAECAERQGQSWDEMEAWWHED